MIGNTPIEKKLTPMFSPTRLTNATAHNIGCGKMTKPSCDRRR